VRALPVAAIVSAAIHAGAVAWLGLRGADPPRSSPGTVEAAPASADPPPVAVVLLDDHTVSATPALPILPHEARVERAMAVAPSIRHTATTATEASVATTPRDRPQPLPTHASLMTMRGPALKTGVSSHFVEHFLANSQPLAAPDIEGDRIADAIATAKGHLDDPRWIANATPDQVSDERLALAEHRDDEATEELQPSDNGHHKVDHSGFRADVDRDGSIHIHDKSNLQAVHACDRESWLCKIPIGAMFDVTDWAMRSRGMDPYASAKLKMLDDTRDQRVAIGARYRTEQLAHSVELARGAVAYLWASTPDPAARKRALFELWDECAETGDAELVESGRAVRAFIIGVIRSKVSYTAEEIAVLNAHRHSKAPFSPYE